METLPQLLESAAASYPERVLIRCNGDSFTYAQGNAAANRIAHALCLEGVGPGDPVALFLPSRPAFAWSYYGAMKAGGVAAALNAMFTTEEVAAMIDYLGASVVITSPELADRVVLARDRLPGLRHIFVTGAADGDVPAGTRDLDALTRGMPETNPGIAVAPDAVATVFHTSGTTGRPKGAAQTHATNVIGMQQLLVSGGWRRLDEEIVCPLPLFNNFGSTVVLNMTVGSANTLSLIERWDAEAVIAALQTATRMVGTPTMYIYLLNAHDAERDGSITLRSCIVGGQTTPAEVREGFEARFGGRLQNLYGATETNAVTLTSLHGSYPEGTVGHPIGQATVRVEDDHGNEAPPGTIGELVLGGDTICTGYWRDEERTKESFGPHGWRSGDLGYVDEQGYVFVVDRKKDLIITGGANIYPAEIEAVLYEHPAVAMATVIGIPDTVKGEIPKAYVVPKAGETVTAEELSAACRARLAAYKCPRDFEFVDSLPTSPVGKILKRELREQVLARAT